VIVPEFIAWSKVAVTADVIATPVSPFVGVTAVTVGAAALTVTLTEPVTAL
jgi:hypothetical protein